MIKGFCDNEQMNLTERKWMASSPVSLVLQFYFSNCYSLIYSSLSVLIYSFTFSVLPFALLGFVLHYSRIISSIYSLFIVLSCIYLSTLTTHYFTYLFINYCPLSYVSIYAIFFPAQTVRNKQKNITSL